jgi:positive regulator of sigma E activity
MTHRPRTTRIIIISFMILVGVCLAQSVNNQNTLGVILAFVSLCAGIYFIHLFNKAKAEIEEAEWRERQE